MDEFAESPPAARPKPSKTPSWIMLGFMLGALFIWALPRRESLASSTPPPAPQKTTAPVALPPPRLTDVEAFFADWGHHAIWANDVTYIAAWNLDTRSYRDAFEVLRSGDRLYFRSVPRPPGLRVLDGVPPNSPLQFFNPVAERSLFSLPSPAPASDGTARGN
jgi:hypothetical protein